MERIVESSSFASDLVAASPNRYGGKQADYLAKSEAAVGRTVGLMKDAAEGGEDLQKLFFTAMQSLAKIRHMIAVSHKTEEAENFGFYRALPDRAPEDTYNTHDTQLADHVAPLEGGLRYSQILLDQVMPHLTAMGQVGQDEKGFTETTRKVKEMAGGEVVSTLTVEVLQKPDVRAFTEPAEFPSGEKMEAATGQTLEELNKDTPPVIMDKLFADYAKIKALRSADKSTFDQLGFLIAHTRLRDPVLHRMGHANVSLSDKSKIYDAFNHILTTLRLPVKGKLYPVIRHLSAVHYETNPVGELVHGRFSFSICLHTDPFLIVDVLQETASIFAQAMKWNKERDSVDNLKNLVGRFSLYYATCMPHARGDGAIGGWLTMALLHFHGFTETKQVRGCLHAYTPLSTLTLEDYLVRFKRSMDVRAPDVASAVDPDAANEQRT